MSLKAFISGCSGLSLSADERAFFAGERPWGLILFARNCQDPAQIRDLIADFRQIVGRDEAPVLIDQEGGRVQRLRPPHWPAYPTGRAYGAVFSKDPAKGRRATWLGARLIAFDLAALGINCDCLPLLDVPVAGAHDVIGDRAYGSDVDTVSILAREAADGLVAGGVLPVAKHIPGHGRAHVDSHLALPIVDTAVDELDRIDFEPFRRLADLPLAMTAHVVYDKLDADNPATCSPDVIARIIRGTIGFDGCLMSDDVSMQALSGTIGERVEALFGAGCDLALHCNGDLAEMQVVAEKSPLLAGDALRRADAALAGLRMPQPLDEAAARAEFEELMALALDV
jgi:beta-N-acetylhexosaminidase